MRILVMGGTNFIGPHVVAALHRHGNEVTVYHRGVHEPDLPSAVRHIHSPRAAIPVLHLLPLHPGTESLRLQAPTSPRRSPGAQPPGLGPVPLATPARSCSEHKRSTADARSARGPEDRAIFVARPVRAGWAASPNEIIRARP
jgi:hypothetical protein